MSSVNACNVTINNQQYYSDVPNQGFRVLGNIATIAWSYTMLITCCGCFMCMLLVSAIIYSTGSSPLVVLILSLCCCASSGYYYYGLNNAKKDLELAKNEVSNSKTSRPCKDPKTGEIYN